MVVSGIFKDVDEFPRVEPGDDAKGESCRARSNILSEQQEHEWISG
ncbi:hypothetical protein [Prosthecochloris sp.]|nr:hypothetical protein [Prosthecochloris sp.]